MQILVDLFAPLIGWSLLLGASACCVLLWLLTFPLQALLARLWRRRP